MTRSKRATCPRCGRLMDQCTCGYLSGDLFLAVAPGIDLNVAQAAQDRIVRSVVAFEAEPEPEPNGDDENGDDDDDDDWF